MYRKFRSPSSGTFIVSPTLEFSPKAYNQGPLCSMYLTLVFKGQLIYQVQSFLISSLFLSKSVVFFPLELGLSNRTTKHRQQSNFTLLHRPKLLKLSIRPLAASKSVFGTRQQALGSIFFHSPSTLQNKEVCAQLNALEKSVKFCHILFITKTHVVQNNTWANFEAFLQGIKVSVNLLFLKSTFTSGLCRKRPFSVVHHKNLCKYIYYYIVSTALTQPIIIDMDGTYRYALLKIMRILLKFLP